MIIHPTKLKYLTDNMEDETPLKIGNVIIEATTKYVYLGAPISNNTISKQIENQLEQKNAHVIKVS
jgi:hypothetical protein